jgi:hypothetical protein
MAEFQEYYRAISWVHGYIKGPDDKPLRVQCRVVSAES